jgi:homoserine kinase
MRKTLSHHSVTVRVPATTANMGPGFDSLGLALSRWNRIQIEVGKPFGVKIHGEGAGHLRSDKSNLIYRAALRLLSAVGAPEMDLRITAWQEVPLSRGLGSSACAIVGGLVAANALLDFPLTPPRYRDGPPCRWRSPASVAATLVGGCCIAVDDPQRLEERVQVAQVPLPDDLQCVVFIPERHMPTQKARGILGSQVSRQDAVFNIGRTALLVAGLSTNRPELLGLATQDRLHQSARQQVFPAMKQLFAGALKAGAYGVFLSGAGSSVVALTSKSEHRAMTIGYEMADAADKLRLPGEFVVLEPDLTGAEVLAIDGETREV